MWTKTVHRLNKLYGLSPRMVPCLTGEESLPTLGEVTREELGILCNRFGFTSGVEVGVRDGEFSECLIKGNPGMALTSIDPWQAYRAGRTVVTQKEQDAIYASAVARLSKYPTVTIVREDNLVTVTRIPDQSLDFVYLDGDHEFGQVARELVAWTPKVRPGGLMTGHDFRRSIRSSHHMQVVEAVMGFLTAYHIDTGFRIRPSGRHDHPSWGFVVPRGYGRD